MNRLLQELGYMLVALILVDIFLLVVWLVCSYVARQRARRSA